MRAVYDAVATVQPAVTVLPALRRGNVVGALQLGLRPPSGGLDATRRTLGERSQVPVLFVRAGLRPGGLAPERTLTRFSWSLSDP